MSGKIWRHAQRNYTVNNPIVQLYLLMFIKEKKRAHDGSQTCSTLRIFRLTLSCVRAGEGFLFILWCQGTGQSRQKHWWQNCADPTKPQRCGFSQLCGLCEKALWVLLGGGGWGGGAVYGMWNYSSASDYLNTCTLLQVQTHNGAVVIEHRCVG